MKKAVVDQIALWLIIFLSFVTLMFLIVDYYTFIKAKDKTDTLTTFGVRMVALNKSTTDIVSNLNDLKGDYFQTIYEDNLTCVDLGTQNYKVILRSNITLKTNRITGNNETLYSTAVAFNETNPSDINCSLNLSLAN